MKNYTRTLNFQEYSKLKNIIRPLSEMIMDWRNASSMLEVRTNAIMKAAAEKLVLRIAYPINPNSNAKPTSQIDALDE